MLVVDASCLFEVLVGTPRAAAIGARLISDDDQVAPHLIDVEVMNVLRDHYLRGRLDLTAARQAVDDLRDWPADRFDHRPLMDRVWELRDTVRGWDAFYVALAESMDATLLTLDRRLARATGPTCTIEIPA